MPHKSERLSLIKMAFSLSNEILTFLRASPNIISSPFSFPLLKHIPYKVHRFKGGKIRILYALSPEAPIFWDSLPGLPEIIFLFVDLRSDETYNDALKILKKMVYKD